MILIWPLLLYFGFRADRLRWHPFFLMALAALLGTLALDHRMTHDPAAGLSQSFRWHPLVMLGDIALTTLLYGASYLIGYAVGTLRRRRTKHK